MRTRSLPQAPWIPTGRCVSYATSGFAGHCRIPSHAAPDPRDKWNPIDLTDAQRRAIEHDGRNLQLIACAGSGKTEVVARRVVHLLTPGRPRSLEPRNIVAFTFTEKAAAELKERIVTRTREALGEIHGMADLFVGTIHAFCLDLLRAEAPEYLKYEVLNEVQQALFVDRQPQERSHHVDGPPGAPAQALRRHQPLRIAPAGAWHSPRRKLPGGSD